MTSPHRKRRPNYVIYFPLYMSVFCLLVYIYVLFYLQPIDHKSNPNLNIDLSDNLPSIEISRKNVGLPIQSIGSFNNFRSSITHPNNIQWLVLLTSLPSTSDYPIYYSLYDILLQWNPDLPDPPAVFKETLQHFNFSDPLERELAIQYRNNEIPFKLYDIPEVITTTNKWTDEYLSNSLRRFRGANTEKSKDNHFLYWSMKGWRRPGNYKPPTEVIDDMKFDQWLIYAKEADEKKISNTTEHYYYMVNSVSNDKSTFIAKDLPIFSTSHPNFFISNPNANKGIQCRFSMRGIIAEAHYDSGRNMIAMLKGQKRYILTPPSTCNQIGIITDVNHPSYRHSNLDWSNINQAKSKGFEQVPAIDTIVKTGEVLYVPSFWFHYIISLEYSIQCNSRFGSPPDKQGQEYIEECLGTKLNFDSYNGYSKLRGKKH